MDAIGKIVLHDDQNNKKQTRYTVCAPLEDFYHQKVSICLTQH